jgi:hypothetical protein
MTRKGRRLGRTNGGGKTWCEVTAPFIGWGDEPRGRGGVKRRPSVADGLKV